MAKSAASGEEAIEVARSFMPDLLISDVVMEGISGIEAANEILTFLPTCKVILFSGQANILDAFRHSSTPSNYQILSKPISPDVLFNV